MTTLLPFLAVIPLFLGVVLFERDPASDHTEERPPNFSAQAAVLQIPEPSFRTFNPEPAPSALAEDLPPTPTTAPAPDAPPAPSQRATGAVSAASAEQFTEPQMRELAAQAGFTEELMTPLLAVTWCESKFSPGAIGKAGEAGLAQVHPMNWGRFDQFPEPDPWNPLQNLIVAYQMSQEGTNYWAWTCRVVLE